MNNAVNKYKKQWFPEDPDVDPCVPELLDSDDDHTDEGNDPPSRQGSRSVVVLCEDYGQAVTLPSYRYKLIVKDTCTLNLQSSKQLQ